MHKLKILWNRLSGKKTYIISIVGTLLNVVVAIDPTLLNSQTLLKIDGVLVALGGAALRHSINTV